MYQTNVYLLIQLNKNYLIQAFLIFWFLVALDSMKSTLMEHVLVSMDIKELIISVYSNKISHVVPIHFSMEINAFVFLDT